MYINKFQSAAVLISVLLAYTTCSLLVVPHLPIPQPIEFMRIDSVLILMISLAIAQCIKDGAFQFATREVFTTSYLKFHQYSLLFAIPLLYGCLFTYWYQRWFIHSNLPVSTTIQLTLYAFGYCLLGLVAAEYAHWFAFGRPRMHPGTRNL